MVEHQAKSGPFLLVYRNIYVAQRAMFTICCYARTKRSPIQHMNVKQEGLKLFGGGGID